ncbi:hypothetical protein [Actinoplanes couchii]|uniref:Uncharacterized protein n=1 Tax=Actinoplanes couchii TaxID=403638 RepID=A0ABQ3XDN7_9ACTN|nr:hypothetical protein [Actinoplanes couchii]MDR6317101.1 hypothetical protein [Actinoplanes couchii]GID56596.1 hypothetical protein Aco03nite_050000 [Actinoplanes couchii]
MTERREPSTLESAGVMFGLALVSAGLVALSLWTASGVKQIGPTSFETEFAQPGWGCSALLLVIPIFLAAWRHTRFMALMAAAALIPQFIGAGLVIDRTVAAGWGDGMTGFAWILPLGFTPFFFGAALIGAEVGKAYRRPAVTRFPPPPA